MVTREQIVAAAREWIGTPYRHQGRIKGEAVDCGGLVVRVCQDLGLTTFDHTNYDRYPDGSLECICEEHMVYVPPAAARAGDVLLFNWEGLPSHMGFATGNDTVLHAFLLRRQVVEHRMDEHWKQAVMAAYHIPGVEA